VFEMWTRGGYSKAKGKWIITEDEASPHETPCVSLKYVILVLSMA